MTHADHPGPDLPDSADATRPGSPDPVPAHSAGERTHERSADDLVAAARREVAASERSSAAPAGESAGDVIDRYTLLEPIGEGGMGTVWRASQTEPVKREVALKVIKLGMDTREVVVRFEAERQALALMDHPGIAKVIDGGATRNGRPYFVMELVQGSPITDFCREHQLGLRERLELFGKVCEAVQHAHHKGVIHRDLKPSNVLVAMGDSGPQPKVIDFGIAKATSAELTNQTMFTQAGQIIGTPEYMAPEQAGMDGSDIDTRADVYSLGVLMYELLTGTKPFDMRVALQVGYDELMRQIREVPPAKPSTRVSGLSVEEATTAIPRRVNVETLSRRLRGDLDWVVMKAIEKDRARRYDTPTGLADDVARFLAREPVEAAPPSATYRLRKFVQRRKKSVAAVGVIALLFVGGAVGTGYGLVRALDEKRRADILAEEARDAADAESIARREAQQNEERAVAEARRAKVIKDFVVETLGSGSAMSERGSQDKTVLEAMEDALADIETGRFSEDPYSEAELLAIIARVFSDNGRRVEAEPLLVRALGMQRELFPGDSEATATMLSNMGNMLRELGRPAEAESFARESISMQRRGDARGRARAMSLNHLAAARGDQGFREEAATIYREALDQLEADDDLPSEEDAHDPGGRERRRSIEIAVTRHNLAIELMGLERFEEAEALVARALEELRRVSDDDDPRTALFLDTYASTLIARSAFDEAIEHYTASLEMRRRLYEGSHPETALCITNIANLHAMRGRPNDAMGLHVEALAMYREIYPDGHPDVARGLQFVASNHAARGENDEVGPLMEEAVAMYRELLEGPDLRLAHALAFLASQREVTRRFTEGHELRAEALAIYERLPDLDAEVLRDALEKAARSAWMAGRSNYAAERYLDLHEDLAQSGAGGSTALQEAALNVAVNLRDAGRAREALAYLDEALALRADPRFPDAVLDALELDVLSRAGVQDRAAAIVEARLESARATHREGSLRMVGELEDLATALLNLGDARAAEPLLREVAAFYAKRRQPSWAAHVNAARLGAALTDLGQLDEAEELLTAARSGLADSIASKVPPQRLPYYECLEALARLADARGDDAGFEEWRELLATTRPYFDELRPTDR
ncbi:Serine/threonine-protein kinase PknB [Planctomycetes bacterium Pla163]|uniref:Serine/threonine-protein kinase PknB n=1 Tax=Rohdeia mirabilis TaxID=2528008 RepID=A0A518CV65_9BACT|nr:Serine/threonine-protein kinase PknB [Planctomycetes bacterium Pla163]